MNATATKRTRRAKTKPVDLAAEINRRHEELVRLARKTVEMAIAIGGLLEEQKAKLKHGEFGPWCKEHLSFSDKTRARYMNLYRKRDEILKIVTMTNLSLTDAYRYLTDGDAIMEEFYALDAEEKASLASRGTPELPLLEQEEAKALRNAQEKAVIARWDAREAARKAEMAAADPEPRVTRPSYRDQGRFALVWREFGRLHWLCRLKSVHSEDEQDLRDALAVELFKSGDTPERLLQDIRDAVAFLEEVLKRGTTKEAHLCPKCEKQMHHRASPLCVNCDQLSTI